MKMKKHLSVEYILLKSKSSFYHVYYGDGLLMLYPLRCITHVFSALENMKSNSFRK